MNFASDNAGPMHPQVLDAVIRANDGTQMPYGADTIMDGVKARVREIFEAPEAAVYLVATGTAANALALATYANPWDAIFCHRTSHTEKDECGAPEFYAGGAKLKLVDGSDGKMTPTALEASMAETGGSVHGVQTGPVSITQVTELGTLYTTTEIGDLAEVAKSHGANVHLDGARFANAMSRLNCSAADMTWRAGVDAVSFGGTKNGCAGVEAVILFDPDKAWEFELRRKRGAHLFSKHRFLSGQMEGYLKDDLWLDLARKANANSDQLAAGLRGIDNARLLHEPQANMIFAELPRAAHRRAKAAGAQYYVTSPGATLDGPDETPLTCRLVCDWSKTEDQIDQLLSLFRG
ncbi:threonine aldolase family protein [Litoreibacter roseus]|uniref:L-threonine aldolase n=1 Tax=Litoreibacter roseus TaxID=2601869 RepID=A0A6N6JJB3_9RHOB|nr:aminotransferase class V-fold PLP-dependent enzyme [Litoreibacter roseus]GFE65282.1 L-threonine aldolase [Litoreibacter roseus]